MENPFEIILAEIKKLDDKLSQLQLSLKNPDTDPKHDLVFIPVTKIIDTYLSRSSFYMHVKQGTIRIYKLGDKTFVKADEFFTSFIPVELNN